MAGQTSAAARFVLTRLIDVVPEFTQLEPFRDNNLNNWRKTGAYSVVGVSSKGFTLQVNQREYAATLFADAQHLLNHASEQRANILVQLEADADPSPSWLFVSLYYFSLFAALAWGRANNAAVIYLDKDAIGTFCQGNSGAPGGGAYRLSLTTDPTTGAALLEAKKCGASHFHEAVWISVCASVADAEKWVRSLSLSRQPTPDEIHALRVFQLFGGMRFSDPLIWPSRLRNAINYRPGYSYRTAINHNFLRIGSRLRQASTADMESLLLIAEKARAVALKATDPTHVSNELVDLLIVQSVAIEAYTDEALHELCISKDLECSARALRRRFNKKHSGQSNVLSRLVSI